ncbi:MAG: DNA polymerase III subunit gamma/tau [Planctomycetota bacterium]|jgi:DNA polymerase-3 subunit gamma/tau
MSYRVLARTYRSSTFDEIVGQEAIATTLVNAISSGRVHHGYLFTGTRGVGKTSMARILAKALNCFSFDAATTTPCCKCESCKTIAEGEDVDVVEIDAASNTGVDNIRDLRSNATFRPARSRFKIYIIDEVHMLSTGAFNALLKTLEEPPPHVKFILATTEPEKVPATIQSRCQRFDFRAIDSTAIATHLQKITEAEKIEADEGVLRRIARLAGGSMRDAVSLLDKLLSYEPTNLTSAIADEVIPPPHDELASAVIEAVAKHDAAAALQALDRALQSGRTVERFCDHLIDHVRTLMLLRVCGKDTDLVDVTAQVRPQLSEQAQPFDAPTYVYIITLLEELRRNVKFSGAARALADAAIVRLAMSHQFTDINELIENLDRPAGERSAPLEPTGSKRNDAESSEAPNAPMTRGDAPAEHASEGQTPRGGAGHDVTKDVGEGKVSSGEGPAKVTSADWEKVARDPFVERVREAVEGTLFDVRPAKRISEPEPAPDEAEGAAEDG